jgi:hypothetical protein
VPDYNEAGEKKTSYKKSYAKICFKKYYICGSCEKKMAI